jgi:nucleotide-binding universal stress UspA family protein
VLVPSDSPVKLRSILSPIDFSEESRQALRWAAALAVRFQSRLSVFSAVDQLLADAAKIRLGQDLRVETEAALREFVAETWTHGPQASLQPALETRIGDPAAAILDASASADLIVIGTQGLGGLRKLLVGSTTERVLRQTRVPVLAVPPSRDGRSGAEPGAIAHILAVTDFSEASTSAARMAADLAAAFSARLTLSHVVEALTVPPPLQGLVLESTDTRVAAVRPQLAALAAQICGGQTCDQVVVVGQPADRIGSLAAELGVQVIAMGLAGAHGALGPRPGSIAYRVLSAAMIPVLVVPRA